ncbi:MAG TPA: serine hydrolase [Mycobacteriales bacterium]|nr:serine hydrolase [Mycobacteriales bacterium]
MTVVGGRTALDLAVQRLVGELDRWHVPGLELAVVRDGEVLFAGGLGVRGVDDATPVGPRTLFRHGSCGKAYSSLAATVLAEEGVLDLDVPVRRYVPELRLPDMTIADRVTTRDLLSHRGGLGRHDFTWIANPAWDATELLARLEHLPLAGDLRAQFVYSNLGYAVAGIAMERAAGVSWSDVLHSRVLERGGMTRSWIDVQRTVSDQDRATPHVERDGKAVVTTWRPISGAAPAGAVMTCADDAAQWLLLHTGADYLPAGAVTATHALQTPTPAGMSPFPELRLYGYGMGWLVSTWRGRPMVSHTGGIDGFTTHTLVLTEQRIGVTISVNQHLSSLAMAGCLDIADALLGESAETSWFDALRGGADAEIAPGQREPEEPSAVRPPVHPLTSYAGVFVNPGYGELHVAVVGGALSVRIGELECTARHRRLDTWDVHYDALDVDVPVVFQTDADGAVSRAVAQFEGEEPVAYVRKSSGD